MHIIAMGGLIERRHRLTLGHHRQVDLLPQPPISVLLNSRTLTDGHAKAAKAWKGPPGLGGPLQAGRPLTVPKGRVAWRVLPSLSHLCVDGRRASGPSAEHTDCGTGHRRPRSRAREILAARAQQDLRTVCRSRE